MATTEKELFAKYGIELERLRSELVTNINNQGGNVSSTATLQELVPEVGNLEGITPYVLTSKKILENTGFGTSTLKSYTDLNAVIVGTGTFGYAYQCSYIDLPNALEIGEGAFANWSYSYSDVTVNIPNIEIINRAAFSSAGGIYTWFKKNVETNFENVHTLYSGAFLGMVSTNISDCIFTFPKVVSLPSECFTNCVFGLGTTLNFPNLTYVNNSAFKTIGGYNASLSINLPKVNAIYSYGFCAISASGVDVYFPADGINTLFTGAFMSFNGRIGVVGQSRTELDNSIISIFKSISTIPSNCFYNYFTKNSQAIRFDNVTSIGQNAFSSAVFASITFNSNKPITVGSSAFYGVTSPVGDLTMKTVYAYAFAGASISSAYIYSTSTVSGILYSNAFRNASYLNSVTGYINSIPSGAFVGCSNLNALYLYNVNSSITTLTVSASYAFSGTAIYNGLGSIYVPASLYYTYISATNWIALSSAFVSVADM